MRTRHPSRRQRSPRHRSQAGFTLIELLIACVLLIVGVMTMAGLVGLTVKNNGHSRLDSTATMINQAVVEQVTAGVNYMAFGGTGTASMYDCGIHTTAANYPWPVSSVFGGANLQQTGPNAGYIDFSEPKTDVNLQGYQMDYVVCNGGNQVTYDVRWNISQLAPTGITSFTHILTVGTQMEGGSAGIINFPINMRVMVGPDPMPGS